MRSVVRIVCGIIMVVCIVFVALLLFLSIDQKYNKTDLSDLSDLSDYSQIRKEYFSESMKSIWPLSISADTVTDYNLISYYDDVDAYTGYLKIEYNEREYRDEVARLKKLEANDYIGKYNAHGFSEHEVLTIHVREHTNGNSEGYNGFTYALNVGENEIVYVELEFPRDSPREDYKKIIPDNYLPDGLTFPGEGFKPNFIDLLTGILLPAAFGLIFSLIGLNNIRRKDKFGYLEIAFAVMMVIHVAQNILV